MCVYIYIYAYVCLFVCLFLTSSSGSESLVRVQLQGPNFTVPLMLISWMTMYTSTSASMSMSTSMSGLCLCLCLISRMTPRRMCNAYTVRVCVCYVYTVYCVRTSMCNVYTCISRTPHSWMTLNSTRAPSPPWPSPPSASEKSEPKPGEIPPGINIDNNHHHVLQCFTLTFIIEVQI